MRQGFPDERDEQPQERREHRCGALGGDGRILVLQAGDDLPYRLIGLIRDLIRLARGGQPRVLLLRHVHGTPRQRLNAHVANERR
jgi:hypothetical protein